MNTEDSRTTAGRGEAAEVARGGDRRAGVNESGTQPGGGADLTRRRVPAPTDVTAQLVRRFGARLVAAAMGERDSSRVYRVTHGQVTVDADFPPRLAVAIRMLPQLSEVRGGAQIDEVAVLRALWGEPMALNKAEQRAVMDQMRGSAAQVAAAAGVSMRTVVRHRRLARE